MPETPQHRRARRTRIRRTVAATGLATFALAWGVIAGTGSMGASTAASTSTSSATSGSSAAASSSTYDRQSDDDWGDSSQSQQQSSDLTTRQS
jgi:hypothetical protein